MLPPDAAGKPEIFDHPKVSRVDEIGRTNRGGSRGGGGGGGGGRSGEWDSGNIAPSPTMGGQGDKAGKSEIFNHPKVNVVDGSNTITMRGGIITIIGGIMGKMESTSLESLHNAWAMEDAKG
nr:hypothetical protein Iba_chr15bCG2830 [Ipomoea batatas]